MSQLFTVLFVVVVTFASHELFAQGSQENREGKVFGLNLEVIGFTMMPVQGIRASYFMTPNTLLELGYAFGNAETSSYRDKNKYSKQLIEAKVKHFVWHSLYIDGGLGMELWNLKYTVDKDATDFNKKTLKGTASNTGVEFHLGNQWQWSNFTLGCDWIGYFLAVSTTTNFADDDDVDQDDKRYEEKDVKNIIEGSSYHLGRLYLGWSF